MYSDFNNFLNEKTNSKDFSINDFRRNSFLVLQDNKYRKQVIKQVASPLILEKTYSAFFSQKNIDVLQVSIKNELFSRTNKRFVLEEDQDENSLKIVMKYIFTEHGNVDSVEKLNSKLIEYVMPDILSGVKQYIGYVDKINSPLDPINRPLNANKKGRNQLRSVTTVWN